MKRWHSGRPGTLAVILFLLVGTVSAAPVHLVDEAPAAITTVAPGVFLVDFERVAFGNLRLTPPADASGDISLHFGESMTDGRIERKPPGSVRYSKVKVSLSGSTPLVAAPPANARNIEQVSSKHPPAVLTPPEWGVVTPFRWVEIEGWPGNLLPEHLHRQAAFSSKWDDSAAAFHSSDDLLNRIWELCRYSIKASTFAGIFVDGDRERIAYEADTFVTQQSHYTTDNDVQMVRDTFDWLMKHPTWPTECALHMVFIAHSDWMHTGDTQWLAPRYELLKSKLLRDRVRGDGLVVSNAAQIGHDLVDWPPGERDQFVFKPVNTVINAFHLRSLALMAEMATALNHDVDASSYQEQERIARAAFQEKLFAPELGLYFDGEGTDHTSLHANLFPLAFGLVPTEFRAGLIAWLNKRGMACSVYVAQFLLDGLFEYGADRQALALMTAEGDRSWKHMLESGTTITWEAWDQKYKTNQDWNHPWGAAPANLLPRFVLGARPLVPGWKRTVIRPNPGHLQTAEGKIPTPLGPLLVRWNNEGNFRMHLALPAGVRARVELPATTDSSGVYIDDKSVPAQRTESRWIPEVDVSGTVVIELR